MLVHQEFFCLKVVLFAVQQDSYCWHYDTMYRMAMVGTGTDVRDIVPVFNKEIYIFDLYGVGSDMCTFCFMY